MTENDAAAALTVMGPVMGVVALAMLILFFFVWFNIFKKSGHSGWLALLLIVPLVNLITLLWFAFSEWPVQKKLKELTGGAPSA